MTIDNSNANPSIDPANEDSLLGLMKVAIKNAMMNMDGVLPAIVVSYDRAINRAQVQPTIKMVNTNGQNISRAQIASVPVYQYGGGGFMLNFPIKTGSTGWILACDNDISQFLQTYSNSAPNTYRKNSFSDGVFFPDAMIGYLVASEDSDNAVLQNLDGTVKISLGLDTIKIEAPNIEMNATTQISLTSPTIVIGASSSLAISSSGLSINSASEIIVTTPKLAATGDITATGTITPSTPP